MSKDKYVYLGLYIPGDHIYIKVAESEYKEMLRALRMWDDAKHYWLQDAIGRLYNINKYNYIFITKHEPAIKLMDQDHERYLKEQGLI